MRSGPTVTSICMRPSLKWALKQDTLALNLQAQVEPNVMSLSKLNLKRPCSEDTSFPQNDQNLWFSLHVPAPHKPGHSSCRAKNYRI